MGRLVREGVLARDPVVGAASTGRPPQGLSPRTLRHRFLRATGLAQGGIAHACAIDDAGAVYCWGWNGAGQLGDATTTNRLVPTAVSSTIQFNSVALGSAYSCGMSGEALS